MDVQRDGLSFREDSNLFCGHRTKHRARTHRARESNKEPDTYPQIQKARLEEAALMVTLCKHCTYDEPDDDVLFALTFAQSMPTPTFLQEYLAPLRRRSITSVRKKYQLRVC